MNCASARNGHKNSQALVKPSGNVFVFFPFGQSSSLLILGEDGWKSSYGVRTWLEAIVLIVLIILI